MLAPPDGGYGVDGEGVVAQVVVGIREVDLEGPGLACDAAADVAVLETVLRDEDAIDGVENRLGVVADGEDVEAEKDVDVLTRVPGGLSGVRADQDGVDAPRAQFGVGFEQGADFGMCGDGTVALDATDGDVADCLVELFA